MKCPKCNSDIVDGCCVRCGYLLNGNFVRNREVEKNEDLKLFNKDYESLLYNKKLLLIFILGPLYFSYRGFLITSLLSIIIDRYLYFLFMDIVNHSIFMLSSFSMQLIYFVISRLIYVIFSNSICILIDKLKIKMYKMIYKENCKEKISNHKHHKFYLIIAIVVYIILIFDLF